MKRSPIHKTLWLSLPLGILLGATGALAGVSLLDEADEHVGKAESALRKVADQETPGAFGGHRKRALEALGDAKREIKKAKDFVGASDPAPTPPKKTDPTPPKKTDPVPPKKKDPTPPKKTDPVPPKKPPETPPTLPKK